jgi:hypothetical protein
MTDSPLQAASRGLPGRDGAAALWFGSMDASRSRASSKPPVPRSSHAAPGGLAEPPSGPGASHRPGEECILAFPAARGAIRAATAYRSTLLVSSLETLRERGHFESYSRLLTRYREEILTSVAGSWLPIAVARAHYEACDALDLSVPEQLSIGRSVGARAQGSIFATAAKTARSAGVTPLTILPQFNRLWQRGVNGGAGAIFLVGPKEARAEFVGCELFDVDFFRQGFRGVLLGVGALFCRMPYIHDLPRPGRGQAIFQMQWT